MEERLRVEIEGTIRRILVSELEVSATFVAASNSNTPLLGRGIGLDSVETLTLVAGIEKEFDIQVDDADLTAELFTNIGTLSRYVMEKVLKQGDPR